LAFENSNCPDYITEKLWRILDSNIVPVVMGGGNYTRDAPQNSVINVNDFPSVKALADYLTYLTENPVSTYFNPECPVLYIGPNQILARNKNLLVGFKLCMLDSIKNEII
jgi:hypothetical protein